MPTDCISFRETNYFSSLICDYLDEKKELDPFYNRFPDIEGFKGQIEEKSTAMQPETRAVLSKVLRGQYKELKASALTRAHIDSLENNNTFTITTGHQLNLFTGPLYFLYKIISAINLTTALKEAYPDHHFVPVYWMATEDHDFDEINYFNFKGKKVQWPRESSGAVGRLDTQTLEDVYEAFASQLGQGQRADTLKNLFKEAYLNHDNLADATRYLANALFGEFGLVIIDADDTELKQLFIPYMERELTEQLSHQYVAETNAAINALNYKVQVNPREINLFYLKDGLRERLVKQDGIFKVNNTELTFNSEAILEELSKHPERFSPNVIMRPLYQEVILPNLCYIGGGGELAYWLQLKSCFEAMQVPFPILLLRNSVLIQSERQSEKLQKLGLNTKNLFLKQQVLIDAQVAKLSDVDIDFTPQKEYLKKQFEDLYKLAEQTDKSFLGAVGAQERKQIKGLEHLEKRLLKAQKRRLSEKIIRITTLQNELFPDKAFRNANVIFLNFI